MQTSSLFAAFLACAVATPALAGDPVARGPYGGSPYGVVIDPTDENMVLVTELTSMGLMRSSDGGVTFAPVGTGLPYPPDKLFADPNSPQHVLAVNYNTISESFDFGDTWFPNSLSAGGIRDVAIQPGGSVWLAADYGNVYRSADDGATWTTVHNASSIGDIAFAPSDPSVVYIGSMDGVERSTDGGLTFANAGLDTEWAKAVHVDPNDPNTVYAGGIGGLMRVSTDGGATWSMRDNGIPATSTQFLMQNGSTMYAGMLTGIWRTDDGGLTWLDTNTGFIGDFAPVPTALAFKSDGNMLLATELGLYRTSTPGGDWEIAGFSTVDIYDVEITGPNGWRIASNKRGLYEALDGDTFTPALFNIDLGYNTNDLTVDPTDSTRWISGGRQGFIDSAAIRVHTNNGADTAQPYVMWGAGEVQAVRFDPHDSDHVVVGIWPAAFGHFGLVESFDAGDTWTEVAGSEYLGTFSISFDPFQAGHYIALGNNGQYVETFDGGATLEIVDAWPTNGDSVCVAFDPFAPGVLYGASESTGVFRSDDGGATWTSLGLTADRRSQFEMHSDAPGVFYFADGSGRVMLTGDRGDTWVEVFATENGAPISSLAVDPADGDLLIATRGSSLYEIPRGAHYLRIGDGVAGDGGFVPRAYAGPGLLQTDGPWDLHADDLQGGAFTILYIGLGETRAPAFGGTWYADLPAVFLGVQFADGTPGLEGDGSVTYGFNVPDDSHLAGFEIFAQMICQDTSVLPTNITLTNAWRATILP